jgi:hypothetical protein
VKALHWRHLAALAVAIVVVACGDVPTLEGGIAFISPIQLPAPAVAVGDTLRDSLGRATPLSVIAFDRNDAVIPGVTATYVVTTLPPGVSISASGIVVGFDSITTAQIVGLVGGRLQTVPAQLEVVPQPDFMAKSGAIDSLKPLTASSPLIVNVTGPRGGAPVPVKGIIVRYRIANLYPARAIDPTVVFFTKGLRTDLTQAVDTTTANPGTATETITMTSTAGTDSVAVEATANNLRGMPLSGNPVRFVIPVKKGS